MSSFRDNTEGENCLKVIQAMCVKSNSHAQAIYVSKFTPVCNILRCANRPVNCVRVGFITRRISYENKPFLD